MPRKYADIEADAYAAKEAYEKAQSKVEIESVIREYGRKIGYKPLIRICILGWEVEEALAGYVK